MFKKTTGNDGWRCVSPELAEAVDVADGSEQTQQVGVKRQQERETADVACQPLHTEIHYVTNGCRLLYTDIHYVTNGCSLVYTDIHYVTNGCRLL